MRKSIYKRLWRYPRKLILSETVETSMAVDISEIVDISDIVDFLGI